MLLPKVLFHCIILGLLTLTCACTMTTAAAGWTHPNYTEKPQSQHESIQLIQFKVEELQTYVIILAYVMVSILVKMLYHQMEAVAAVLPESCLLILIGAALGAILRYTITSDYYYLKLSPNLFFYILLPPIVLEAAYSLHNVAFVNNIGTILLFAVLGSVLNFLLLGCGLWVVNETFYPEVELNLMKLLLFSALIVAVDPVAVLAIFTEIGVNQSLYFTVFGESLLNDAVTVVLYEVVTELLHIAHSSLGDYFLGVASFFIVSVMAILIGSIVGVITCLLTRCTQPMQLLEPLILFTAGYFAYVFTNLLGWSGIIATVSCGLVQAAYAFHNIAPKSRTVVKKMAKILAGTSEGVIFIFLGAALFVEQLEWNFKFILWSLALCLVARTLVVLLLCFVINHVRRKSQYISFTEQGIIIYGGLRGAVAYSLAAAITPNSTMKSLFLTATLANILFTVGVMGVTMKPLVRLFRIRLLRKSKLSMLCEVNDIAGHHILTAMEAIAGHAGKHRLIDWFIRFDDKQIRPLLLRDPLTNSQKIFRTYAKIALALHHATVNPHEAEKYLNKLVRYRQKIHSIIPEERHSTAAAATEPERLMLKEDQDQVGAAASKRKPSSRLMSIVGMTNGSLLPENSSGEMANLLRRNRFNSVKPNANYSAQLTDAIKRKQSLFTPAAAMGWNESQPSEGEEDYTILPAITLERPKGRSSVLFHPEGVVNRVFTTLDEETTIV